MCVRGCYPGWIGTSIGRRSAAFVLASAIVGTTCVATTSFTIAQAVHVVVAVAKYAGLTAAFAEALRQLAGAVAESYGTGRTVTDDVACRRQQAALRELVISLRDLEVEKRQLHVRLERASTRLSHWLDLREAGTQAQRVSISIREIKAQVEENREAFAGNAAVSRAYGNLVMSFDAKQNLLRDLVAEMQAIDWTWARVDRRDARRSASDLRPLAQELERHIETIAQATDVIADHAEVLCEPPIG
jgi:hypothetical protein